MVSFPPGALHFWENIGTAELPDFVEVSQNYLTFDAGRSSKVKLTDIDQDGDVDLFFLPTNYLGWMENVSSASSPFFILKSYDLTGYHPPFSCHFADLNGDGYPDLVTADGYGGTLTFYVNSYQPEELIFQQVGTIGTDYVINQVTLADMDADGDPDLLFGGYENYPSGNVMVYYENWGMPENPNFVFTTQNYENLSTVPIYALVPNLSDVDLDADYDLLFMNPNTSTVWFWENIGSPQQAQFDSVTNDFLGYDLDVPINVDLADVDNDGDRDFMSSRYNGAMVFFRNVTGEPSAVPPLVRHPQAGFHLSLGPNPANPVTFITFSLPYPQEATLAVYNLLGARVTTLISGLQPPGEQMLA